YNYNVGVDVAKTLSDRTDLTYGFVYDNRGIAADNALTGQVLKHTATLDYAITTDLSAAINYTNMSFDSKTDTEDYAVQKLTTGLSLSF
ncbi:MAG: hypothetical protein MI862_04280, partial [Desulfobacterales bacterium]|nr:hypothetical protein [Desulfobacterales bacterium]